MSYINTIGWKQNNLGNLRGEGINWRGKTGFENGFSVFATKAHGVRAIFADLNAKIKKGVNTISKIMEMYAPRSENNTEKYIQFVAQKTGIARGAVLNFSMLDKIVRAIILYEIGYNIGLDELLQAKNMYLSSVSNVSRETLDPKKKNNFDLIIFAIVICVIIAYYFKLK